MLDLSSAIIGLLLLFPILFLVIYLVWKKRQRSARLERYIQELVQRYQLQVAEQERQYQFLLLLDTANLKLLYLHHLDQTPEEQLIDVKQVQRTRVAEAVQTFYLDDAKKQKEVAVTQISVELYLQNSDQPLSVVFYDHSNNSINQLSELRAKAAHWHTQLNAIVTKKQVKA